MYNYIIKQYSTLLDFLSKKKKKMEKEERSHVPQRIFHFLGHIYCCYYVIIGIPKFSIVQFFSISSQRNNYNVVQNLAQDKKQKIGMKLGWVVTCTTHCPTQFFLLLQKFLVWPLSQALLLKFLVWPFSQAHGTCLCLIGP